MKKKSRFFIDLSLAIVCLILGVIGLVRFIGPAAEVVSESNSVTEITSFRSEDGNEVIVTLQASEMPDQVVVLKHKRRD